MGALIKIARRRLERVFVLIYRTKKGSFKNKSSLFHDPAINFKIQPRLFSFQSHKPE